MDGFDFRKRQSLSDLLRVPGAAAVKEPATAAFASNAPPELIRAALARAIAEVLETETDDPFLACGR